MRHMAVMVISLLIAGCGGLAWDVGRAQVRLDESRAALADEQAALLRQWRECLKRAESDPGVDCSEYRTAIEILDSRGP